MFPEPGPRRRRLLQTALAGAATGAGLGRALAQDTTPDAAAANAAPPAAPNPTAPTPAPIAPTLAPNPPAPAQVKQAEVVIATVTSSPDDDSVRDGVILAVEQLNASGGLLGHKVRVHSETLVQPDRWMRSQAVRIAGDLVAESGLIAVIGHEGLTDALPAAIAYIRYNVLLISPTITLSDLTRHGLTNVFAVMPDNVDITTQTARIAFDIGLRRAVLVRDRSEEALEIALAFRDEAAVLGITVVDERSYRAKDANPSTFLAGLQGLRIDHLVIVAPLDLAIDLVKQASAMALPVTSVLVDFVDPETVRSRLGRVEGRVLLPVLSNRTAPTPDQLAWNRAFSNRFGYRSNDPAVQAADSVGLLAYAAAKVNSINPTDIGRFLRLEAAYTGLAGRMSFKPNGRIYTRLLAFASVRPDEVAYYMPGA